MGKASLKSTIILFSFVILTGSCSALKDLASSQKPTVAVAGYSVTDISLDDAEITFDLEINNPNPVAVTLANYNYDLQINSNSLVRGNKNTETVVDAHSKSIVKVPVRFGFSDLLHLFSSLKGQDETNFNFNTNTGINVPVLGVVEIPLNFEGKIPVVRLPEFELGNLKLTNLSLTKADFEIDLNIQNPNAFDLSFMDLNYNLSLSGLSALSGRTEKETTVGRKSTANIKLPLSVNLMQLGAGIVSIIREGGDFDYALTGNTTVGSSLPFFQAKAFDFDKEGTIGLTR